MDYETEEEYNDDDDCDCKDCKHWAYTANGAGDCRNPRFTIPDTVDPMMYAHEFCALGERENDDKT